MENKSLVCYKYIENNLNSNLHILAIGHENCKPDKPKEGPSNKNRYILHFVAEGKGNFFIDGKKYEVGSNTFFFIPPDHIVEYYPNPLEPWSYYWIEYFGENAGLLSDMAGFSHENPIFITKHPQAIIKRMTRTIQSFDGLCDNLVSLSATFDIFTYIITERFPNKTSRQTSNDRRIKDILTYIDNNYADCDLSLDKIAYYFHFNPSFLSRIFKKSMNVTITKHILNIRMQKAQQLLERGDMTIKAVAYDTGFNDPLYFTRKYQQFFNYSPSEYKKKHKKGK